MSRYVKIGLFITIVGVISVLYILRTADRAGGGKTYTIHAYINDATGLLVDSNVKLAGVNIGKIASIELVGIAGTFDPGDF